MRTFSLIFVLALAPNVGFCGELQDAIVGRVSSDQAREMKSGDFNTHRQANSAKPGAALVSRHFEKGAGATRPAVPSGVAMAKMQPKKPVAAGKAPGRAPVPAKSPTTGSPSLTR